MPELLDRTQAPKAASFRHIPLPPVKQVSLSNGIPVYILPYGTAEVVEVQAVFKGGNNYQTRAGIAKFCLQNMINASKQHNSLQLAQKLDGFGAWMGHQAEEEALSVNLATTSKNLKHTLYLLREVLLEPAFSEEEFSAMKTRTMQKMHVSEQKTSNKATRKFRGQIFGKDHPYGFYFGSGELETLTMSDLKSYYQTFIHPANLSFLLTGRFSESEVLQLLEAEFGGLDRSAFALDSADLTIAPAVPGRFHEHHEGMQSSIRLGYTTISRKHEDYYGMQVANTILGGYFGSRLMRNIREEKGYTYGIYSGFLGLKYGGVFLIQTDVGNEYVEATIAEVKKEMQLLCEKGVEERELDLVKNYMLGQGISRRETLFQLGDTLRFSISQGIPFEEIDRKFAVITGIGTQEIQNLVQKYFRTVDLVEIVVGKKA